MAEKPTTAAMLAELDKTRAILLTLRDERMSDDDRRDLERQIATNAKLRDLVLKLGSVLGV